MMSRLDRRSVMTGAISGAGAVLLGACAGPVRLGEGRKTAPEGGIGGTGIVGTLTDFSSLIVNGARVETTPDMAVTDAFGTVSAQTLAIGHSLTVEAATAPEGLVARRVHITHPVIGRVESVSADRNTARIAGVDVAIEPGARGQAVPGVPVAVSGIWRGGMVVASRIDELSALSRSVLAGAVRHDAESGRLHIGDVPLILDGADAPPTGSFVTLLGRPSPGGFRADELRIGRFTGAAGALTALSVEGYLEPVAAEPFYAITGLGHSFDADAQLAAFRDQRTLFTGPYIGTFAAQTGIPVPEGLSKRRALMRTVLAGQADALKIPAR